MSYTAQCSFFLTSSYYTYRYYLGLIRNIGVYLMGYPVHTNRLLYCLIWNMYGSSLIFQVTLNITIEPMEFHVTGVHVGCKSQSLPSCHTFSCQKLKQMHTVPEKSFLPICPIRTKSLLIYSIRQADQWGPFISRYVFSIMKDIKYNFVHVSECITIFVELTFMWDGKTGGQRAEILPNCNITSKTAFHWVSLLLKSF